MENEAVVYLISGMELRCPAAPAPCEYVRVVDAGGNEVVYYDQNEFTENAAEVLGALMGALVNGG